MLKAPNYKLREYIVYANPRVSNKLIDKITVFILPVEQAQIYL